MIVAGGNDATLAAKGATATIPIVFAIGGDPIVLGLVASLNRPGGNVTGTTVLGTQLVPKRLQLLHELLPKAARFGVLEDPAAVTRYIDADLEVAARMLGLQLVFVNARTDSDLETAFATFSRQRVDAFLVGANTSFYQRRMEQLVALAARHSLPAIFPYREYVPVGGLMSYGSNLGYMYHELGIYAGRVLKGEKPADLPVQQITKIDLGINLKTAKALGLTIPETLLATADEVIQ
jgi:putative ABC transport system substrate-binding protein